MTSEPKHHKHPSRSKTQHYQSSGYYSKNASYYEYGYEDDEYYYYEDYYPSHPQRREYRHKRQATEKHADHGYGQGKQRHRVVIDRSNRKAFSKKDILKLFRSIPFENVERLLKAPTESAIVSKTSFEPEANASFALPLADCQKNPNRNYSEYKSKNAPPTSVSLLIFQ